MREKNRKRNFREIVRKNQHYKLVSSKKWKDKAILHELDWHIEKKNKDIKIERKSKSQSPKRKTVLVDWYVIPEVWKGK